MKDYSAYIGKTKGRLTVIGYSKRPNGNSSIVMCTFLQCKCNCGNEYHIRPGQFERHETLSCGCWKKEIFKDIVYRDGRTKYSEYHVWWDMNNRCKNPSHKEYKRYGGRGITVCEEWNNDFWRFFYDMGERPTVLHSIERINNNEGYSNENCKWATMKEQAQNRRPRTKSNKQTIYINT